MTREEFDIEFDQYRNYLREEVFRFRSFVAVYRNLHERMNDRIEAINLAPAFFQIVDSSLFSVIVIWADKLLDEHGQRGLFNFLIFIENNKKWLSAKELQRRRNYQDGHWMLKDRTTITFASISAHRDQIRSLDAVQSFKIRRDKFHGHFDKAYFYDRARLDKEAPIRWNDLGATCALMGEIINVYSADFDGKVYTWEPININDLNVLLEYAQIALLQEKNE